MVATDANPALFVKWWGKVRNKRESRQLLIDGYKQILQIQCQGNQEPWFSSWHHKAWRAGQPCWCANSAGRVPHLSATRPHGLLLSSHARFLFPMKHRAFCPWKFLQINLPPQRHLLTSDKWRPWSVSSSELHTRITLSISGNFAFSPIALFNICCLRLQKLIRKQGQLEICNDTVLTFFFFFFF